MKVAPTGFELDLGEKRVQFSVDSVEHLMNWLEELRLAASPALNRLSRSSRTSLAEEVDMQQVDESKLFDLFAEREEGAPSPSNNLSFSVVETGTPDANRLRRRLMLSVGVSEGEEEDEPPPLVERVSSEEDIQGTVPGSFCQAGPGAAPNALSQLRHLEVEMTGVVDKWSRTLAATEVDCRALLRFFGLGSGSSSDAEGARQLLQALSAFQGQVRTAWAELDQHAAKAKTRGPKGRTRRTAASEALSDSSRATSRAACASTYADDEAGHEGAEHREAGEEEAGRDEAQQPEEAEQPEEPEQPEEGREVASFMTVKSTDS
ncbi:unnamed protein product [Effrenium voratum]|nr:unnamed protein product [Effrenium voratum]